MSNQTDREGFVETVKRAALAYPAYLAAVSCLFDGLASEQSSEAMFHALIASYCFGIGLFIQWQEWFR